MTDWTDEDKRKLRREVLNTRGELLFARAVVLFEGETEEQAFPIFAEKYWGKHPYELGISFIGIGGEANYTPFLRMLSAFHISWFIYSDGEENARTRVNKSLEEIMLDLSATHDNIKIIPNEMNIEAYLVSLGYQSQIKNAILKFKEISGEIENKFHRAAKEREVQAMSDEDLRKYMKAYKTKLSPLYAFNIASLETDRAIPQLIRDLFDEMAKFIRVVK